MWSLVLTSWVLHAVTLYMQLASRVLSTKHIIASLAKACSCSFTAANHTLAQRVISMASLASSGGQARRTESDDWGTVLGATSAVPISTPAHETSMPSPAAHPHCTAAEALAWESALSATELGSCSSSTLYASTQVHTSTAAGTFQHSEASAPALLTAETATEVPQPSPSAEMHTLAPIACLPAPRPLFVVVECGSHSIRAVLHDGTRELVRHAAVLDPIMQPGPATCWIHRFPDSQSIVS